GKVVATVSPVGALNVTALTATSVMFSGTETVKASSDGVQALLVKANSPGQTGNLQEWQASSGAVVASMSPTGALTVASFIGNGSGLTNLTAGAVTAGTLSDLRLSPNVALLNRDPQAFAGVTTFSAAGTA